MITVPAFRPAGYHGSSLLNLAEYRWQVAGYAKAPDAGAQIWINVTVNVSAICGEEFLEEAYHRILSIQYPA